MAAISRLGVFGIGLGRDGASFADRGVRIKTTRLTQIGIGGRRYGSAGFAGKQIVTRLSQMGIGSQRYPTGGFLLKSIEPPQTFAAIYPRLRRRRR